MLERGNATLMNPTTHRNDIPDVAVVGVPAKKDNARVAPVPLILKPATAPVIEVVTILNPELHWKWMQRQANDWKERSSLDYDPSKKKKKKGEERNHLSITTPAQPDDSRCWKSNFELLLDFQRRRGHCRIPDDETTTGTAASVQQKKLLRWVSDQQTQYKNVLTGQGTTAPTLTRERIELLDSIGFEWNRPSEMRKTGVRDDQMWNLKLEQLRAFQQQHGHCRVPQKYAVDPSFGQWIAHQRYYKKHFDKGVSSSGITQERIDKLDSIGFEWEIRGGRSSWNQKFELLRKFQREHLHCRVPQNYAS